MSNKVMYGLELVYVAPQNSIDEKGDPVQVYYRHLGLDEDTHKMVVDQMLEGQTDIFIPTETKFSDGEKVDNVTFVNLNSRELMRASTFCEEELSEEDVKNKDKPVIYKADGKVANIN